MKIGILGAGPGGYVAAIRAAQRGADVTIIEQAEVGGTCLNRGCIPTKTILASTEALAKAKKLREFGIDVDGTILPNMKKIIQRKNTVVATQVKGIRSLFKRWNISLIEGTGKFISDKAIHVTKKNGTEERVFADAFIIATGSRPAQLPSLPLDGDYIISSKEALDLSEVPESLLIIGAGVIGCEFASIYRELGTDVTVIELMDRAVSTEDEAISRILEREFKKKKIKLITRVKVEKVAIRNSVYALLSNREEVIADKCLVSIGRQMNSEEIGIERAGVTSGTRGEIPVNHSLQTNIPHIYAIGDVTGGTMLAHVASRQGVIAAENIMGAQKTYDPAAVPSAIFTSPEIGSVGMREHEAKEMGISYRIGEFQFRGLGKAHAMGEISGLVKIITKKDNDRILGSHIIGPHASDLIHEIAVSMQAGLTARDIAETIHAHPTLSEGIMEAAEDVHGTSIHIVK